MYERASKYRLKLSYEMYCNWVDACSKSLVVVKKTLKLLKTIIINYSKAQSYFFNAWMIY